MCSTMRCAVLTQGMGYQFVDVRARAWSADMLEVPLLLNVWYCASSVKSVLLPYRMLLYDEVVAWLCNAP